MARCLCVLLMLALLLGGCATQSAEPTVPITSSGPEISAPAGLYVPQSAVEENTNGAVRSFKLENADYFDCAVVGEELILMHTSEGIGTFTLYAGANLEQVRTINLGTNVAPTRAQMQINAQGIGYFDSQAKAVVFLNHDFVEIGRMYLPQEITGSAWLTPDWKSVYFCTEKGIHEMDLQTGISRLLLEQKAYFQEITGGFGDGEVLRYVLEITEGQKETILIDAETGMALQKGAAFDNLVTQDQQYFLPDVIRGVRQLRFGNEEAHQVLWPGEVTAEPVMLFANNAVMMVETVDQQTSLSYYDLVTGKHFADITLEGVTEVWGIRGDGKGGVWLFARDTENVQWLYHWNCAKNRVMDPEQYTEPLYSPETPNTEGLAQVAQDAQSVGNKFGIEVLTWQDAVAVAPADQFFTAEYMTQIYDYYLPRLEQALSIFPEGMFAKVADKLQIALVKEIAGEPAWGTLAQTDCVQFYDGNTAVVAVTLTENFERELYHGLYLALETRVLSKSSALYEWFRLNPSDFKYDNSYIANLNRWDTTYITGGNMYFIDLFSMSYAKEDRATIFEYACMPGNGDYFQTTIMREKRKRICNGVREAYGLKNVETTYLWEQYLP